MKPFHLARQTGTFLARLVHDFMEDRCFQSAGALAYVSLLALVPLLTIGFTVFTTFPAFDGFVEKTQAFIFSVFMPENAQAIQAYLRDFMEKAATLTLPGLIALLATAFLAMNGIDQTFNAIWKTRRHGNLVNTFTAYWAVLTLGPILIGVSFVATSYVASLSLSFHADTDPGGPGPLLALLPFFATMLAFTLLYAVVPRQRVPVRHAMAGGMAAAALFEAAKKGFTLFITHFSSYEAIYGALAAVPISLIWIYLSWLIILLGAEFTHCLGNRHSVPRDAKGPAGKTEREIHEIPPDPASPGAKIPG
uniref:UPF0761 membrane protein BECKSD772D_GA0070982_10906 n=1 Tax=Candidatus Kentrum sp. SD TaxID=2126332 RepID=A0A451BPI0_9GAMM|nr:MAG: membrane protein [Candidatus Kentron sp. SD]